MNLEQFLEKIMEIKDVSLATVSKEGNPKNRVIDMMYLEDSCLYFLTARGKDLYQELSINPHVALSSCVNRVAYTLTGKAVEVDREKYLFKLFDNNKFMYDLYPGDTKKALVVYKIDEWSGEYFDLNKKPIERGSYSNTKTSESGYFINPAYCVSCGACYNVCPTKCIDFQNKTIRQENCLHCGNCMKECPDKAVWRR